jgi:hypothetical protein
MFPIWELPASHLGSSARLSWLRGFQCRSPLLRGRCQNISNLWDLRFSRRWLWRMPSSGMWRRVDIFVNRRFGGTYRLGRAIAQAVSCWLPTAAVRGSSPGSGHVGFVVDRVALGQVFSKYFGFPCQSSFHQLLHNHPHLSSGLCTIGQKWPQCLGT